MRAKYLLLSLICTVAFWFYLSPSVHADLKIVDDGDFFSESEIIELETSHQNTKFNYYIQTISSLNGEPIDQLSEELLNEVSSEGYHAVLLLSQADREIYMNVNRGTTIDRLVRQISDTDPFGLLIEQTFIPYAVEGDFSQGVHSLLSEIESLELRSENQVEQNTNQPPVENSVNPSTPATTPTMSSTSVFIIIMVLLVVVFVIFLIGWFIQQRKMKQQIVDLAEQQKNLLSGILEPYNITTNRLKISQGYTKEQFELLNKELFIILNRVKDREGSIQEIKVPLLDYTAFNNAVDPFKKATREDEKSLEQLTSQLKTMTDTELKATHEISSLNQLLIHITNQIQLIKNDHKIKLEVVSKILDEVKGKLNEAKDLDTQFDFLSAYEKLKNVRSQTEKLEADLKTLIEFISEEKSIQEKISETESTLKDIVKKERLLLVDDNPFPLIDEARANLSPFSESISSGNVTKAKEALSFIIARLNQASEKAHTLISFRDFTFREHKKLKEEIRAYVHLNQRFEQELKKLKEQYVSKHWQHLPLQFERLQQLVERILSQLPVVEKLNQIDVQQYKQANKDMQDLLQSFDTIKKLHDECFQLLTVLQNQKQELIDKISENKHIIQTSYHDVIQHKLPYGTSDLERLKQKTLSLQKALAMSPIDLIEIESEYDLAKEQALEHHQAVKNLLSEKRAIERKWQDVKASYQTAMSRYQLSLSSSSFRNRFAMCESNIAQYVDQGRYSEANNEISIAQRIILEMKQEHERILAHQRMMAAQAAARAAARRSNSFGGGSGSSGGGSGWGSSGGGSNWKGNSGGGRKW